MTDTLLFLHLLSAFALVASIVMTSAWVLGAPVNRRSLLVGEVMGAVGGLGTIIFGIWLAIDIKGYAVWDGWIIAAIVLWAASFPTGQQAESALKAGAADEPAGVAIDAKAARLHWVAALLIFLLLVDMVWKPGA
jgi:hypothetical protein